MKRIGDLIKRGVGSPRQGSPSRAGQTNGPATDLASTQPGGQPQTLSAPTTASRSQTELENTPGAPAQAPRVFPTGIQEWWRPSADQPTVLDLVFIHGITGSREGTWTAAGGETPWPKSFIPPLLPNVRILGFGYAADVTHWWKMADQGTVYGYGQSLMNSLYAHRSLDGSTNRPIAFVVHSLGGLVCEACLLQSNGSSAPHLKTIIENTIGIAFLGTPHAGAGDLASWATNTAKLLGLIHNVNTNIVAVLKTDSEVLAILQQGFHNMLKAREPKKIDISCFFEQKQVPGVGWVVPPHSAILPGWNSIPLADKTHMTMTKFEHINDPAFVLTFSEIRRWVSELEARQIQSVPEPAPPKPRTAVEAAALRYAGDLQVRYDPASDLFACSVASKILFSDEQHSINFATVQGRLPDRIFKSYAFSGWLTLLRRFQQEEYETDPRRDEKPLSMVPFSDGRFLACIPTSDVYRILSSSVSERYAQNSAVLVHHTFLSISDKLYEDLPVVKVRYAEDPHFVDHTIIPSTEFAHAIVGASGLAPNSWFPITFKCTVPGHEKIEMPWAMALVSFNRHTVIFSSQFCRALLLLKSCADLLDLAWDDDDAWECTPDQVPIRVCVGEFRSFVKSQRVSSGVDYYEMEYRVSVLRAVCFDYFKQHSSKLEFQNEDIRNLLKDAENFPTNPSPPSQKQLVMQWYGLCGYEGSRWILLALSLTLGLNLGKVWVLPNSFDVLRDHSMCYMN